MFIIEDRRYGLIKRKKLKLFIGLFFCEGF